jgi:hypothetical protein
MDIYVEKNRISSIALSNINRDIIQCISEIDRVLLYLNRQKKITNRYMESNPKGTQHDVDFYRSKR